MGKQYSFNDVFWSIQGEGARSGTAALFVRFAGCNKHCRFCDTKHNVVNFKLSADQLLKLIDSVAGNTKWLILTGGEPMMEVDVELLEVLKTAGYHIALETNGSLPLKEVRPFLDYIAISAKQKEDENHEALPEYDIHPDNDGLEIEEARTLIFDGWDKIEQSKAGIKAMILCVSPAFDGDKMVPENMNLCLDLVSKTGCLLSVQNHKLWGIK